MTLLLLKKTNFQKSFAAKAIKAAKDDGWKVEVGWEFSKWNEFKFQGEISKGQFLTK